MKKSIYRREFLKQTAFGTAAIATGLPFSSFVCKSNERADHKTENFPTPTTAQVTWQNCEVGIIYHFDISVAVGKHTSGNNAYKEVFDPKEYNPKKLDTDQWIEAAKAAGAKYAIFTATHFNGFLQWQSEAYPYGLKQAKWRNGKGDIIGDFINSCHKAGIKPGIYLSTHRNAYWQLWDYYVDWGKGKGTKKQEEFNRVAEKMVEELCSKYGPLVEIWFDAGTKLPHEGGPDVLPIFNKYQPDSVFYSCSKRSDHRWIGNEAGYANYPCWATMPGNNVISHNSSGWKPILGSGDPDGETWSPGMVDIPLRGANGIHNWFWAPDQENGVYSKGQLVKIYYDSVGRNCNLVIGGVINPEGLVPEADVKRLKEFGDEINRRFSNPLATTSVSGNIGTLELSKSSVINQVVLMEDITKGERVRSFELEGKTQNGWQRIFKGTCIGHKFIHRFDEMKVSALRLKILESQGEPRILKFSVYYVKN
jgi:alpha-L-fucosidase